MTTVVTTRSTRLVDRLGWRLLRVESDVARPLVGVLVASFAVSTGLGLIIPLVPLYARDLGVSVSAVGLLVASFSFARVFLDLAGGATFRRFSERQVATVGAATVALGSVMSAAADTFGLLLAGRIVHGAGVALFLAAGLVYIAREVPASSRARAISMHQGALMLGNNIGPAVGGGLGAVAGMRTPFLLAATIGVLAIPMSWRTFPDALTVEPLRQRGRRLVDRRLRWTLAVALAGCALLWGVRASIRFTVFPLFTAEELGYSVAYTGALMSVMFFGDLVGLALGTRAMDVIGRRNTLLLGLVTNAGAFAVTPFLGGAALVPFALVYGMFNGLFAVVPVTVAADIDGRTARTMTSTRVATDLGLLAAPWFGGVLLDGTGYTWAFALHGAVFLLLALVASTTRETRGLRGDGTLDPVGGPADAPPLTP